MKKMRVMKERPEENLFIEQLKQEIEELNKLEKKYWKRYFEEWEEKNGPIPEEDPYEND